MVATTSELEQGIKDFIHKLAKGFSVEAVILFGSHVHGSPHEGSDVDLVVISPDFEVLPLWQRQETIARLSVHRYPGLSPIGYPSSEYHNPRPQSFLAEIIRTGRVVYQAK